MSLLLLLFRLHFMTYWHPESHLPVGVVAKLSSTMSLRSQSPTRRQDFYCMLSFFEAAFPWSEHLLPTGRDDGINVCQECQECASNFNWATVSCSPCRLVWLHFLRKNQPLATDYDKFLYKDTFHSCGQIWQCIALVIHQGPDPLNG